MGRHAAAQKTWWSPTTYFHRPSTAESTAATSTGFPASGPAAVAVPVAAGATPLSRTALWPTCTRVRTAAATQRNYCSPPHVRGAPRGLHQPGHHPLGDLIRPCAPTGVPDLPFDEAAAATTGTRSYFAPGSANVRPRLPPAAPSPRTRTPTAPPQRQRPPANLGSRTTLLREEGLTWMPRGHPRTA